MAQGLVHDAVALGQTDERRPLLLARVRVQVEVEPDALETDRRILRHAERSTEVQVALGSWLALVPAVLLMLVIVARLLDEEKMLSENLPGYQAYRQQVHHRLVPFVW